MSSTKRRGRTVIDGSEENIFTLDEFRAIAENFPNPSKSYWEKRAALMQSDSTDGHHKFLTINSVKIAYQLVRTTDGDTAIEISFAYLPAKLRGQGRFKDAMDTLSQKVKLVYRPSYTWIKRHLHDKTLPQVVTVHYSNGDNYSMFVWGTMSTKTPALLRAYMNIRFGKDAQQAKGIMEILKRNGVDVKGGVINDYTRALMYDRTGVKGYLY